MATRQWWDYRVAATEKPAEGATPAEVERELNELGSLGWELVSVQATGVAMFYFFKRPHELE
jgi:hypothetical protein